jgi:hypothetical protein
MHTDEIVKLSREVINDLIDRRYKPDKRHGGSERRRAPRWPFPGTVEIRPDGGDGLEQWFGTCVNLSDTGLGFTCDERIDPGSRLEIAFHYPEKSVYGRGIVRYAMETPNGWLVGLEFIFEEDQ